MANEQLIKVSHTQKYLVYKPLQKHLKDLLMAY